MSSSILVTGGAGYIGSRVVQQLGDAGERVTVLDNLSTGFASSVLHGKLVVGETGDKELVAKIIKERGVDAVMHCRGPGSPGKSAYLALRRRREDRA